MRFTTIRQVFSPSTLDLDGRIEYHRQIPGKHLRYPRDIVVWLPPSYSRSRFKRFPVLYMQDGQNLMDPATAFLGVDWRADESVNRLIRTGHIEDLIIVGIYNTPDRELEYTGSKEGHHYAEFVIHELKPMIDSIYRTRRNRSNTAVMGSSLGGLISFSFAWWYPQVFGKAAALSGSFFWGHYQILKDVQHYHGQKKRIWIYLDVGSKEVFLRQGYLEMKRALLKRGYKKGVDLEYYLAKGASHNEQSWGLRLWRPLKFLFGKRRPRAKAVKESIRTGEKQDPQ